MKSDQRYEVQIKKYHNGYDQARVFTWYFVRTKRMGERILTLAKKYGPIGIQENIGFTVISDFLKNPREAKLNLMHSEYEVWRYMKNIKHENKPAQIGAQGLSRDVA